MLTSLYTLLLVLFGVVVVGAFDCANSTHEWHSVAGSCFDESEELPMQQVQPMFGRMLGGIGHKPRDGLCPSGETSCWIVNCCQPGEICGELTVGCIISWSTLYTTTTGTMWTTFTDLTTPTSAVQTTVQSTSTAYLTSTTDVTVSGAGMETVFQTSVTTTTALILSAFTPTPTTHLSTQTTIVVVLGSANTEPATITDMKKRGAPEKRTQRTSYTTLTVFVTLFSSATVTSTFTGSVATVTQMAYTTLTAVQTVQHYSTTTGFTTAVVNSTSTYSSFAYGTVEQQTISSVTIRTLISSPASSAAVATNIASIGLAPTSPKKRLSIGAIVGIVIGILAILVILAFVIFCCCYRRRERQRVDSPPLPPSPPLPMAAVNSPVIESPRPLAGYSSRPHNRKSSRTSIVSISPVPEEADEDEYNSSSPENGALAPRRNSNDSTRSWGRGYGGRGGYGAHGRGGSVYNAGSSRGNSQFQGVMTSTYDDKRLVPPHERL